jgi:hypothetical protein
MTDNPYLGEKSMYLELDGSCAGRYEVLGRAQARLLTSHIVDSLKGVVHYPLVPADCPSSSRHALAPKCPQTAHAPARLLP